MCACGSAWCPSCGHTPSPVVKRDWKPGDVAMVECSDYLWRQATYCTQVGDQRPFRKFRDGMLRDADISLARPCVVIDAEDREQVERLTGALAINGANPNDRNYWRETQAALRSLITPPKPEEPTGLGAVVEASCVHNDVLHKWVRGHDAQWHTPEGDPDDWGSLRHVEILSAGWSE